MAGALENVDARLEAILAGWNLWSTLLALLVLFLIVYPIIFGREPDTHPLLLSRQANMSPVRYPGESALYRSVETPIGFPLKTGLDVKDIGASKWARGRDGDVRDIWRRATTGLLSDQGQPTGEKAKLLTVYGREEIETHDIDKLSLEMNAIGSHIKETGGSCVAIYLPNSVESLLAVFAAAFYGFHPVLLPNDQPESSVTRLVQLSGADVLITGAGSVSEESLKKSCPSIKKIIWVVEKTSRHMEWSDPDQGQYCWHELVEQRPSSISSELPADEQGYNAPDLMTVWLNDGSSSGELVSFSQKNIVAAVGAQITALPTRARFNKNDIYLPADSLSHPHILFQTFTMLYVCATVALNSVSGTKVDLQAAATGISPTVIASSAQSALKLHNVTKRTVNNALKKFALSVQTASLDAGIFPPQTLMTTLNPPVKAALGNVPNKLRLLYVFERLHGGTPPLTANEISDLRAFTGARIIYCLTTSRVAGVVSQTGYFDYRRHHHKHGKHSHFGPPVSSVEIKLTDNETHKTVEGGQPQGDIIVSGPAVLGESVNLGKSGTFRQDGTLAFA